MTKQPHVKKTCGAKTKDGTLCKAIAMANGRCCLHAIESTGPPRGNKNALKHGLYTAESIALRKQSSRLIRQSQLTLKDLNKV
jgi:hypothetical protein